MSVKWILVVNELLGIAIHDHEMADKGQRHWVATVSYPDAGHTNGIKCKIG